MKPETFLRVANLSELKSAGPFALSANGVDVVLARTGRGWRAFGGRCPHQGALLGEGELDGDALVCRNHRWRFALDSGQRDGGPECLASCPVAERDGALFVDVTGLPPSAARIAATRSLNDLPGPKPLPLIGNLHQLDPTKAHLIMEEWAARYGSIYQFWMGRRRIVATSEPALLEDVLRARPEIFRRPENMDRIISELGVKGVFNAEGEVWRPQRKLSVAALAQRNIHRLFPSIQIVAERLKTRWERSASASETLDMVAELKRFTVDVTMLIVFGHDVNTVEQGNDIIQGELGVILPAINRRLFALVPTWRYVQTPSDRRLNRAFVNVRAWLDGLLAEARTRLKTEPDRTLKPSNFVEAMVTASDENGEPYSDDVIMSNLLTMLIAGEDTIAFTAAWAIHHLCDSPRWASEIRREADEILGASIVTGSHDVA
ncbi:MAG: cytochrome P450, partial [Hyphomicrobiales bacterium]|nr:cytochrome P450 [Hyphomicrobiales bacterium]